MRPRVLMAALLPLALLAACKPSFDDRYDKAEHDIRKEAADVDSQLAKQNAASPQATESQGTATPSGSTQSPR